jgi:hypothetical protein
MSITSIQSDGWTSAIVASPSTVARLPEPDSVAARVSRCLTALAQPLVPARSPWAAVDSTTAGRPLVLVQIASTVGPPAACPAATDPLVALAGIELVGPGTHVRPNDDLLAATTEFDGRPVPPAIIERAEALVMGSESRPGAGAPRSVHQLRLYFSPDALGPDRTGRFSPLNVRLTTAVRGERRLLVVPDSVMRWSWRELMTWRLGQLAGATRRSPLPRLTGLPAFTPADTVLARARLEYDASDPLGGAAIAARRREAVSLGPADARLASLLIGSTLLAYGDTAGARAEYRDVTRSAPCARLADAPLYDRVLVDTRDWGVRCSPIPLALVLAHGIAPGGAQWVRGNRVGGTVAAVLTVGLFAIAGERWQRSRAQYQAYTRSIAPPLVEPQLDRANATRASAARYALAGGVAWMASAVAGVVAEWMHPSGETER